LDNEEIKRRLLEVYNRLFADFGPQHWWPGGGPFEVMVGAVLTQSVAWRNVDRAIENLKQAGALSPEGLRRLPLEEVASLIRPCIYYNVKARKLKALVEWFQRDCGDDLQRLREMESPDLRGRLLSVWGIGEETADSIVLYAAEKPVFVIDAYTRRIIDRLGLSPAGDKYRDYQSLFADDLPPEVRLFNEYHALLVCLGKNICRTRPLCRECCLRDICRYGLERKV
jgi:endonuclease-3 related protein